MAHYEQFNHPDHPEWMFASCGQGHCWCNCIDQQTGNTSQLTPVPELSCRHEGGESAECQGKCHSWCDTFDHMHNIGYGPPQPPQPRPARPRQPYTPGRGRGYKRGGKANSNRGTWGSRTQTNPKGKSKKR